MATAFGFWQKKKPAISAINHDHGNRNSSSRGTTSHRHPPTAPINSTANKICAALPHWHVVCGIARGTMCSLLLRLLLAFSGPKPKGMMGIGATRAPSHKHGSRPTAAQQCVQRAATEDCSHSSTQRQGTQLRNVGGGNKAELAAGSKKLRAVQTQTPKTRHLVLGQRMFFLGIKCGRTGHGRSLVANGFG
jgi:hypothetical protein